MKNQNNFDKTKEYESEILDLAFKLRSACNRNGIPMFLSVCVKNDVRETVYKNEMVGAASSGIQLTDDLLVKFVNVLNGFDTVPKVEDGIHDFDFE